MSRRPLTRGACCQSAGKHALGSFVGERPRLCAFVRVPGCGWAWFAEGLKFGMFQGGPIDLRRSAPVCNRTQQGRCAGNGAGVTWRSIPVTKFSRARGDSVRPVLARAVALLV